VSTLAIWLLVLVAGLFVVAVLVVVWSGLATYRRTRALGNEVMAFQEELSAALGSAQTRGLSSEEDPA
jgi:hypothetical protein